MTQVVQHLTCAATANEFFIQRKVGLNKFHLVLPPDQGAEFYWFILASGSSFIGWYCILDCTLYSGSLLYSVEYWSSESRDWNIELKCWLLYWYTAVPLQWLAWPVCLSSLSLLCTADAPMYCTLLGWAELHWPMPHVLYPAWLGWAALACVTWLKRHHLYCRDWSDIYAFHWTEALMRYSTFLFFTT